MGRVRGIQEVSKAQCYRTVVVDASRRCTNGCKYCYDKKWAGIRDTIYKKAGNVTPLSIDYVRSQLNGNTQLKKYLDTYRAVRIGALCDIKKDDHESYEKTRMLMQLLWGMGYKYMLVTKSAHSIDNDLLDDMKRHDGILSVTIGYYRDDHGKLFEDIDVVPLEDRRDLMCRAIDKGIKTTLRLNPMHPHYMDDVLATLDWYKSIGGNRVVLEVLRISAGWKKYMPGVNFNNYVTVKSGGIYSGYLTPQRELAELMYRMAISYANSIGIDKVTVCADMESNIKFGYRPNDMDCCQLSEIWDIPVPKLEEINDAGTKE